MTACAADSAADEFGALVRDAGSDDGRCARVWLLACLADTPDEQEAALAQARALLADDTTAPYAIAWIVARGYDSDVRPTMRRFEALDELLRADLSHLLALVVWYTATGEARVAVRLLVKAQVRRLGSPPGAGHRPNDACPAAGGVVRRSRR